MPTLQQWLISQRELKQLSQEQLAIKLGKCVSYIQHIEQGQYILDVIEYLEYCRCIDADPSIGISLIEQQFIDNQ